MQCGRETNYHAKIPTEILVELTGYFPRVLSSGLMGISVVSLNLVLSGTNRPRSYEKSSDRTDIRTRMGNSHFLEL